MCCHGALCLHYGLYNVYIYANFRGFNINPCLNSFMYLCNIFHIINYKNVNGVKDIWKLRIIRTSDMNICISCKIPISLWFFSQVCKRKKRMSFEKFVFFCFCMKWWVTNLFIFPLLGTHVPFKWCFPYSKVLFLTINYLHTYIFLDLSSVKVL